MFQQINERGKYGIIHTTEYYSATAYTLKFENIMVIEISQKQKTNILMYHLNEIYKISKFRERESRLQVSKGWRREEWKLLLNGYRVSISGDERVFCKWIVITVAQHCEYS